MDRHLQLANRSQNRSRRSLTLSFHPQSRLLETLESRLLLSADVLAHHNGGLNTGENLSETLLSPTSIASSQAASSISTNFGRLFDTTLDGQVYAQILAKSNVNITRGPSQGIHDVLYVATMHDSLYAIDANTGAILWQDNFLQINNPEVTGSTTPTTGVSTVPSAAQSGTFPELGILSTPVIDPASGIIYVETHSEEFRSGSTPVATAAGHDTHYVQRLWAINLSDGSVAISPSNPSVEPPSGGQVIADTIFNSTNFSNFTGYKYVAGPYIKGSGDNGANDSTPLDGWAANAADTTSPWGAVGSTPMQTGYIAFNAQIQMTRTALTLINGVVYVASASHADQGPYYGWILGYNARDLSNTVAFVTAPTFEPFSLVSGNDGNFDAQAGIWGSGTTITTDGTYLYITDGNGAFNFQANNFSSTFTTTDSGHTVQLPLDNDYADAVLKLQLDPNANQSNINILSGTLNNPNGTYDPDGGYNANGFGMKVVDYFIPSNAYELNKNDADLGSAGVLLLPSTGPEGVTAANGDPMVAVAGKEGRVYLLDANNLGGYNAQYVTDGHEMTNDDPAPYDRVLGEFYYFESLPGNSATKANNNSLRVFGNLSYFNGEIYVSWNGTPELGFSVANFPFSSTPHTGVQPTPNFTTTTFGLRGTTASISANGTTNGIIWNLNVAPGASDALLAYDTSGNLLFSSAWKLAGAANNTSDSLTNGVSGATGTKFSLPTIYNGMVYAGTGATSAANIGSVVGYGLLNPTLNTPTNLQAQWTSPTSAHLIWSLAPSDQESATLIERSLNGTTGWTPVQIISSGLTSADDPTLASGTQYFYRATEINAAKKSSLSLTANTTTPTWIPGDTNGDGRVDIQDLNTVTAHWQAGGVVNGATGGDLTGPAGIPDGMITIQDLNIVTAHWQDGTSQSAAATIAPAATSPTTPSKQTHHSKPPHAAPTPLRILTAPHIAPNPFASESHASATPNNPSPSRSELDLSLVPPMLASILA